METIQSEPITNLDLNLKSDTEKTVVEKEMTLMPKKTTGEKEKIKIDETSVVELPIETIQTIEKEKEKEQEPEMITTIANTLTKPSETKETKKSSVKKKKVKLLIEE